MLDNRNMNWLAPFLAAADLTQDQLADAMGLSRATINRLANDHRKLKRDRAEEMAPHLQVTADQLMLNTPPASGKPDLTYVPLPEHDSNWRPEPDFEGEAYSRETYRPRVAGALPELDIKMGAGQGAVGEIMTLEVNGEAYSGHRITGEWLFPADFLRDSGTSPTQSIVAAIDGDSMIPTYLPGDRAVVDLSQNAMMSDGVYMISDGSSPPQVKRLQRIPFSQPVKVAIISDNPAYQNFEVPLAAVLILGKVSWHIGRR